jgi:hypothetical protein
MVVSFAIWTILAAEYENHGGNTGGSASKGFGIGQICFIWIFGIFYSIGFSGLLVAYTLEVLPFHLRAKGITIMNITVQAILALSAQTNNIAINNLPKAYYFWIFYTVSHDYTFIPWRLPGRLCALHVLMWVLSAGISSKPSGYTSSLLKPRARLLRKSLPSLMVMMLLLTLI